MNCIRQENPWLLSYGALHFSKRNLETIDAVKAVVDKDLSDSSLSVDDLKSNVVLLHFICEGQCDKIIKNLILYLRSIPVKDIVVVFNADVDVSTLDYKAISKTSLMVDHGQWFTKLQEHPQIWQTDCNFLCLLRRPNMSRAALGGRLLAEFKSMRLSFGSMSPANRLVQYQPWFPGQKLPLLLDGPTFSDSNSFWSVYDTINPLFRTCAINIVAETSSQSDANAWNSIFVTEKTFKAFGMLQIPIWWAVPGVVNCVRNMGFDLFDDIIDHGYDNEHDESKRLDLLIAELKKLEALDPFQLRIDLRSRLEENFKKLDTMVRSENGRIRSIIKELNLDMPV
jgi:hypothetical protein